MKPTSLSALLAWYRDEVGDDIPQRTHSKDIDLGGAPEWHAYFRQWLTSHPAAEDRDGNVKSPLRYWLWRMNNKRARYLFILASVGFSWRYAARIHGIYDDDAAHDFTRESLSRLWRAMYKQTRDGQVVANETTRESRKECAQAGCDRRTSRLYCPEHGKSEAQRDAERAA